MSTVQFNMKLDAKQKKQAELLAKKFGLSLSSVMRSFVCYFVRERDVGFLFQDDDNTPDDLTGKELERRLIADGWSSNKAKRHGKAFDQARKAERDGTLIRWQDV